MLKGILFLGKLALALLALCGVLIAGIYYVNWSAEKKAKLFCDEILVGSDVSLAINRAKQGKIFYGDYRGFTFYFPGFVFDKAVCAVTVDSDRKVTSKGSEMEYD